MQKLTALTALILLVAMLFTMVACDNTTDTSKEQSNDAVTSTDASTPDEESRYVADVPTTGYEGETVIFMIRDEEHGAFHTWDFVNNKPNFCAREIFKDDIEKLENVGKKKTNKKPTKKTK